MYAIFKRAFGLKFIGICEDMDNAILALYNQTLSNREHEFYESIYPTDNLEVAAQTWWRMAGNQVYEFQPAQFWGD